MATVWCGPTTRAHGRHREQDRKELNLNLKEGIVNAQSQSPPEISDHVHPRIYMAAAGLLVWFVIAAWLLFGCLGSIELALAMVTRLVFMTMAIPPALRPTHLTPPRPSL